MEYSMLEFHKSHKDLLSVTRSNNEGCGFYFDVLGSKKRKVNVFLLWMCHGWRIECFYLVIMMVFIQVPVNRPVIVEEMVYIDLHNNQELENVLI